MPKNASRFPPLSLLSPPILPFLSLRPVNLRPELTPWNTTKIYVAIGTLAHHSTQICEASRRWRSRSEMVLRPAHATLKQLAAKVRNPPKSAVPEGREWVGSGHSLRSVLMSVMRTEPPFAHVAVACAENPSPAARKLTSAALLTIVVIQARRFINNFRVSIYFERAPSRSKAIYTKRVDWQFGPTSGYQIGNYFSCDRAELKTVIRVAETVENGFMLF